MANAADKSLLDAIRRVNASVINDDGSIKTFKEQLLEFEYGYFNATMPFVVLPDSAPLSQAQVGDHPIIMRPSTLRKLKDKHDMDYADIAELAGMICNDNVLMLDSYTQPHSLCMYLGATGSHDAPLFAAFNLDKKRNTFDVNELATVYERENVGFTIMKTWDKGLRLFPNEKTEGWLHALGLRLPGDIASLLTRNYRMASKGRRIPAAGIIPPGAGTRGREGPLVTQEPQADLAADLAAAERRSREARGAHTGNKERKRG